MPAASTFADRVKETTTTTGTGTITLAGAASQFITFNTAFGTGVAFDYAIVGQSGTEWEVGEGVLATSSTLTRTTVRASSNANAAVSFSAGTKDVFATLGATTVNKYCVQADVLKIASLRL